MGVKSGVCGWEKEDKDKRAHCMWNGHDSDGVDGRKESEMEGTLILSRGEA